MKKIRVLFIVVFLFSIFMIFIQIRDKVESERINDDLEKIYYSEKENVIDSKDKESKYKEIKDKTPIKITKETPVVLDEFKPLLEKNKNIVGWLKIENTNIDYPVVQAQDNEFYLDHDFYGKRNSQGSIFMDFRNRIDLDNKHTIIYGHHMKNRTMFDDLSFFRDKEFFEKNKTFMMKSLYEEHTYQIFSTHVYENDPYIIKTRFNNDEFLLFIQLIKEKAEYDTGVNITDDDQVLTLITCSYDFKDARYVVHAKKID